MHLIPIPTSRVEREYLDSRKFGFGPGQTRLAKCVGTRPVMGGYNEVISHRVCGANVYTGTGFADIDGAPFKAYYCPACAKDMGAT